ncbi:proline-rich receptor-like protein kinase PERK2 [Oncorhynchus mykiss]|uniref:proline-rich receptor-like protein kinase PERK2 n=1 Tax=Oncorhynchus mykiss TaxID=8022 RepID=UPI001878506A|nr:proline-rich receptor-like protein kinase PERK2 [Oncorhynchus mykiss]XP_036804944.1 proline-rich receptor-like protein kinase PERK2 [Oncorhynchus mykiss]XP_036804948.1 proline-rich receptor-like protein kinase PERK2 [Oncorhynchus mykiss]XP_036804949.1 proline-rich receptor-like protein kinase PERK2 [Oncorhynchus mykiss]XP_036804950.1 proline-rich receptor-like protein kinase PERK2 [Oncorhynchus mykiss]
MSLPDLDDRLPPVPPLHRPLNPSQVPVVTPPDDTAPPAASQDPGDDEYIGPDGVSGYQHVVLLATSQPLPPPPSLSSTSLPITPVFQDLPLTSTPLPPPAGGPKVSRTTEWRRRKKLESGIKVRAHKPYEGYKCSKCGKPKTSEFGHSMYGSVRFCAATSGGQTVEE